MKSDVYPRKSVALHRHLLQFSAQDAVFLHCGGRFSRLHALAAAGGHQSEGGLVLDQLAPLTEPLRLAHEPAAAARRPRVRNVGVKAVLSPESPGLRRCCASHLLFFQAPPTTNGNWYWSFLRGRAKQCRVNS